MMPGIAGQFFKNFGFTVVAAVLISLAVARLITPMIAAYFLKAKGHASHGEGWMMDSYMAVLALDPAPSLDDRGRRRRLASSLTVVAFMMLPQTFLPRHRPDFSQRQRRDGARVPRSSRPARSRDQVAAMLRRQPEVESVFARVRVGSATVSATLKDEERERTSHGFRARGGAELNRDRRRPRLLPLAARPAGAALNLTLGGADPVQLNRVAQPARRGDGDDPGAGRAAGQRRPAAARDHHHAARSTLPPTSA